MPSSTKNKLIESSSPPFEPMQQHLSDLLREAVAELCRRKLLPAEAAKTPIQITANSKKQRQTETRGDYSSNTAMQLAPLARCAPYDLADQLLEALPQSEQIASCKVVKPGFINFFCAEQNFTPLINAILSERQNFGRQTVDKEDSVQIEFVSSNPTGPLHIGHGRIAAYGDSLANILTAAGRSVSREFYINDAGRQIKVLALSLWLRYLERLGEETPPFPAKAYQGDYLRELADELAQHSGRDFVGHTKRIPWPAPDDPAKTPNKDPLIKDKAKKTDSDEQQIAEDLLDEFLEVALTRLGNSGFERLRQWTLEKMIALNRNTLERFRVRFDSWHSEQRMLSKDQNCANTIAKLERTGHVYLQDGAIWFESTTFGDDKDRVLVRANNESTYFASDISYHIDKFKRNFKTLINVWGSDHHGYVQRLKSAMLALGYSQRRMNFKLLQLVALRRGGERIAMSTRGGSFVTLDALSDEISVDAARFFYLMRRADQQLEFDLDLATSRSRDNPVYVVQYAHARACSVFKQLASRDQNWQPERGLKHLKHLNSATETELFHRLAAYPEIIQRAAKQFEPCLLANYLHELAHVFHSCYNENTILTEDQLLRDARLCWCEASRQVIANGLELIGVSAPESM